MPDEAHRPTRVELFPFRFRDPVSGMGTRAPYVATRDEIAARYARWEIIGPPEIRVGHVGSFNPHRPEGHLPIEERPSRSRPSANRRPTWSRMNRR
jgi:hypothetical protein